MSRGKDLWFILLYKDCIKGLESRGINQSVIGHLTWATDYRSNIFASVAIGDGWPSAVWKYPIRLKIINFLVGDRGICHRLSGSCDNRKSEKGLDLFCLPFLERGNFIPDFLYKDQNSFNICPEIISAKLSALIRRNAVQLELRNRQDRNLLCKYCLPNI